MVEISSFWDRARALGGTVRSALTPAPETTDALGGFYGASPETQEMFTIIEARIEEARAIAAERGDRPTLEDYRQACVAFGETEQGQTMAADGRWGPKVYAQLSNHNLSGFGIAEPKLALKHQREGDLAPSSQSGAERAMTNLLDLDSDGAISKFYNEINFTGADLSNAYVDPATSFNDEIAKAGTMKGMHFNGMRDGDTFKFYRGEHEDITLTGVNGGKVVFDDHSHVHGLKIEGKQAKITIGDHASVDDLQVSEGFGILKLKMGRNSLLSNADLTHSTIGMNSEFEHGATLQNVQLGENVRGLDFSGLRLNNVTIDGVPIQRLSDLDRFGISYDDSTRASVSPEMARNYELAQIRETMQGAIASIGSGSAAASVPAQAVNTSVTTQLAAESSTNSLAQSARAKEIADVSAARFGDDPIAAARAMAAQLGIVGGASVNLSDVGLTTQVASLERTVPEHEQASGANMNRSASANA